MSRSISVTKEHKHRQIWSPKIILVPYGRHHVPKYNTWMQDPSLQYLTGSEPLTLEGEYEMYESWCNDPNKCTFIVLDRARFESIDGDAVEREIESMIGDVNFYLVDSVEPKAEIEVMIAVTSERNRGFGKAAALCMLQFAHEHVGVDKFEAKIKLNNIASQHLFCDVFGFVEVSRSEVFEEITYLADLTTHQRCPLKQMLNENKVEHFLL